MTKEDKNIDVIHQFRETLKDYKIVGGGSWVFSAHAVLEYKGKRIDDEVEVSIWFDGYGDLSCSVNLPATNEEEAPAENSEAPAEETTEGLNGLGGIKDFFEKNGKTLLISAGVATASVIAVALISKYFHKKKEEEKQKLLMQPKPVPAINGVPKKRRKKKKGGYDNDLDGTETVIALM